MSTSDLLNEPGSLCSCGGIGCAEASAWAEGPILEPALGQVDLGGSEATARAVLAKATEQIRRDVAATTRPLPPSAAIRIRQRELEVFITPEEPREYGTTHRPPVPWFMAAAMPKAVAAFRAALERALTDGTAR